MTVQRQAGGDGGRAPRGSNKAGCGKQLDGDGRSPDQRTETRRNGVMQNAPRERQRPRDLK